MMAGPYWILLLVLGTLHQSDATQPTCKKDGVYLAGYCYWFAPLRAHGSWADAGADCRQLSQRTHLYRPSSQEQQAELASLMHNISLSNNTAWAIDYNKLLNGARWLHTDFSVPKYNTINNHVQNGSCGVLAYANNGLDLVQQARECDVGSVRAICQKKMCLDGFDNNNNTNNNNTNPDEVQQCSSAPAHINNTVVSFSGGAVMMPYANGTVGTYECVDGYEPSGSPTVTCLDSTWSTTDYQCLDACETLASNGIDPFSVTLDNATPDSAKSNVSQLYAAAELGNATVVGQLLACINKTANLTEIVQQKYSVQTGQQTAVDITTDAEVMQLFIDYSVDIDVPDQYGETALLKAAVNNQTDLVIVLVAGGATTIDKNNALYAAAGYGNAQVLTILLDNGADINYVSGSKDQSALQSAAKYCKEDAINVLINALGVNLDLQDSDGNTALHLMAESRKATVALATLLVDAGADHTIQNDDTETAAQVARDDDVGNYLAGL